MSNISRDFARAAVVVVIALTFAAVQAGGTQAAKQRPADVGAAQAQKCRDGGGTATYEEDRTVGSGVTFTSVSCRGGIFDGITCDNGLNATNCYGGRSTGSSKPHRGPNRTLTMDVIRLVATEAAPEPIVSTSDSSVVAPDAVPSIDDGETAMAPLEDEG